MTEWLANMIWKALRKVSVKLHDWVFDAERHRRIRQRHRGRWWGYTVAAMDTPGRGDDKRAEAWAIQFKFETPPKNAEVEDVRRYFKDEPPPEGSRWHRTEQGAYIYR